MNISPKSTKKVIQQWVNIDQRTFYRGSNVFEIRMADDPTQLISTFTHTELVGIVSLMYGMLLHSGATSR